MTDLADRPPAFDGIAGFARRDITPPAGINLRGWGASTHDVSDGTHRPLTVTALTLSAVNDGAPLVLVAVDHLEFGDLVNDVTRFVSDAIPQELGIDAARIMIACSHTHASPWLISRRVADPGGHLFESYVETLRDAIVDATRAALACSEPATLTWASGRCDLATNRDLVDPQDPTRYLVGYNPDNRADDTVLVGRVTRASDSRIIGTVINYACHPTSLGWDNRLASPDYVGAMREVVERHTDGAPCVFLQGASGELAPAYQYGADPDLADRHGRRLGYAAISTLEGMQAPGYELALDRITESGAPLAVWEPRQFSPDSTLVAKRIEVELPLMGEVVPEIGDDGGEAAPSWAMERSLRKRDIVQSMQVNPIHLTPAWIWRVGDAFFVGQPNEAYSAFQTELRAAFPGTAIAVMNLVNDSDVVAYLAPEDLAGLDLYQVWQSPYGPTSLATLIDACKEAVTRLSDPT